MPNHTFASFLCHPRFLFFALLIMSAALAASCSSSDTVAPEAQKNAAPKTTAAKKNVPAAAEVTARAEKTQPTKPAEPPKPITSWPIATLRKKCIEFKDLKIGASGQASSCTVASFGSFGSTEDKTYYYATYCITPRGKSPVPCGGQGSENPPRALAIFNAPHGSDTADLFLERAHADYGEYSYEQPVINKTACGTVLDIPTERTGKAGNGARYARETYLLKNNALSSKIDAQSWVREFSAPEGTELRKEPWADLYSMKAYIPLFKHSDTDTEPTGGFAYVTLSCENNTIKIAKMTVETLKRPDKKRK